jgi:hypothetical protein
MDVAAPDYSIVLPAHNEEALVPATLEKPRDAMAGGSWGKGLAAPWQT